MVPSTREIVYGGPAQPIAIYQKLTWLTSFGISAFKNVGSGGSSSLDFLDRLSDVALEKDAPRFLVIVAPDTIVWDSNSIFTDLRLSMKDARFVSASGDISDSISPCDDTCLIVGSDTTDGSDVIGYVCG